MIFNFRWLPTVLCAANNKLLINAALGFDSYLVMRHGNYNTNNTTDSSSSTKNEDKYITDTNLISKGNGSNSNINNNGDSATSRLGCYFCNDIVAATNSQKDRTLDQQCTVTRPGLSFIAAALSVEMMVAVLHDDKKKMNTDEDATSSIVTAKDIPHQVRGSVADYTQITPHVSTCH